MKTIKSIFIIFLSFIFYSCFAQKEANIWYFGQYAGLDFNSGEPVALTNSAMSQHEGCATISDSDGNLLFYTDGMTVWNKQHQVMPNGTGLMGHPSSTQSGVIVPKPGSNNIYYIFTVPAEIGNSGLRYSVVDLSLNGGLGDVTSDKNIYITGPTEEKITAVKHNNNFDIWVITHNWDSDEFLAYLVTSDGINSNPVISNVGTFHSGPDVHGSMKVSPDGKKLIIIVRQLESFELFDFNNSTGVLSNTITFPPNYDLPYGIEFSPDCSKLYIGKYSNGSNIYQFDLKAGSPQAIINSSTNIGSVSNQHLGALQLAPDNKIYVSKHDNLWGDDYLGVINQPNIQGTDCDFVEDGFYLEGKKCIWGLPNFIQSYVMIYFTYMPNCFGDSTYFTINNPNAVDSVNWDFGDPSTGNQNFSNELNPFHIFSSPGEFTVTLTIYSNGNSNTITQIVVINNSPEICLGNDTTICSGDSIILNAGSGYETYIWQDGSLGSIFNAYESGLYWVEVTDSNGCIAADTILLTVIPSQNVFLGNDTSFCYGNSVILYPGSGFVNYLWQNGSSDSIFIAGNTGYYWVEVTDTNGCTAIDSVYITVFMDYEISIGDDTLTICEGDYLFLDPGPGFESYLWQDSSSYQTFIADTAGIYWVEVTDTNSCAARDSILLIVRKIPENFLGNDTVICPGDIITLNAGEGFVQYFWQDGSSDSVFIADSVGTYWVYVEDEIGCSGSDTVVLFPFISPSLNLQDEVFICKGDSISFNAGSGYLFYNWQDGSNDSVFIAYDEGLYWVNVLTDCGFYSDSILLSFYETAYLFLGNDTNICPGEIIELNPGDFNEYLWQDGSEDNLFIVTEPGIYWVKIFDGKCYASDTIFVDECSSLWVPNIFTPNGDNFNDYFYAVGSNITKFKMEIFNRWGRRLQTLNNINEKWDGKYKGNKCSQGVYYWIANFEISDKSGNKINKTLKGSVTLYR